MGHTRTERQLVINKKFNESCIHLWHTNILLQQILWIKTFMFERSHILTAAVTVMKENMFCI